MDEILCLYLLSPEGYEKMTTIVAAPDEQIAKEKYTDIPQIKELVNMGVKINSINVTMGLSMQGYTIEVFKSGMFH